MLFTIITIACAVAAIGFIFFSTTEEATEEASVNEMHVEDTQQKDAA